MTGIIRFSEKIGQELKQTHATRETTLQAPPTCGFPRFKGD
jgi:hypothetical protein